MVAQNDVAADHVREARVPPQFGCPAVTVRDAPDERKTHDCPDVLVRDDHQRRLQFETDVRNSLAEEWPGEFVELRPCGREQFDAIGIQAIDSNRERHTGSSVRLESD